MCYCREPAGNFHVWTTKTSRVVTTVCGDVRVVLLLALFIAVVFVVSKSFCPTITLSGCIVA